MFHYKIQGWRSYLDSVVTAASRLLAPINSVCLVCHSTVRREVAEVPNLCEGCIRSIPWIHHVACPICGRPDPCDDCLRREETFFIRNRSSVRYDDEMKEWLARYKYRGDEKLLDVFGAMMEHAFQLQLEGLKPLIGQAGAARFDCIAYVPLSGQRIQERGFNQAQKLAEKIGVRHRIPVIPLLRRIRHTDKQSLKARRQRLEDLRDAFVVNERPLSLLAPIVSTRKPRIMLIDDVYTTGSSLNECSRTICHRISAEIYGLTWAR